MCVCVRGGIIVVVWTELEKPQNKHMEINAKGVKYYDFNFLNLQKYVYPNLKISFKSRGLLLTDSVYKKIKYELLSELT